MKIFYPSTWKWSLSGRNFFCFFNVNFIVKKKETHEFESMKFRTPSILSTSLNLIQAKVDFWGIFRLSFKSNLGSETVLGPNSLCDGRKRDANHRLSQTYSKLDLITSWLHFSCFQQFCCFSLRPLIDSREFLCFSFTKTQCTRNPCFLCVLVIPWCWSQWFCLLPQSPYGVPYNLRQTSPWKSWRKTLR